MFKPISDYMVVELARDAESKIDLPDNIINQSDNVFIVKAVGPGTILDNGQLFTPDVKVGDKVIIAGKLVKFIIEGNAVFVGRMSDVVGVDREEEKRDPALV